MKYTALSMILFLSFPNALLYTMHRINKDINLDNLSREDRGSMAYLIGMIDSVTPDSETVMDPRLPQTLEELTNIITYNCYNILLTKVALGQMQLIQSRFTEDKGIHNTIELLKKELQKHLLTLEKLSTSGTQASNSVCP